MFSERFDGRDGIATVLRSSDDHIDYAAATVVALLILTSSAFFTRLVSLERVFRLRSLIVSRDAVRVADEVFYAGYFSDFSCKQFCGQPCAENFTVNGFDGRDGIATVLRSSDDHIDYAAATVVALLILPSSAFFTRLVSLERVFRLRSLIVSRDAVRVADEVFYAGYFGDFSCKQFCGQPCAENFAVNG
ncbi:hypothetical protein F2Q69_00013433 [Brassica cretica]|uniref:Uncharacterized protein n=1 Tax=Brassica cretica TaxID=69181 RepID=A0A8S9QRQ0_BRACR|nr:hypothetical protein F2Q69_00013433 [Brassica cretica]